MKNVTIYRKTVQKTKNVFRLPKSSFLYWFILGAVVLIVAGTIWWSWSENFTQTDTTESPTQISKAKLTLDVLKNSEYLSQDTGTRIKLVNGTYPLKPLAGESQADYFVKLDTDHIVFGDLNNDGQEDAVVILISQSGGTGTFRQLAVVLNSNGSFSNVTNQNLGDRTAINSLTVSSGVISVDMTSWNGGIGTRKTVNYKLSGNKLVEF